jgi:hypothetical protein
VQIAPLQLLRVSEQPRMTDRKHVVRIPDLIRPVAFGDVFEFRSTIEVAAAAMRLPENRM